MTPHTYSMPIIETDMVRRGSSLQMSGVLYMHPRDYFMLEVRLIVRRGMADVLRWLGQS